MADNYLEKRFEELYGTPKGQETVAVHGNLVVRKRGGKIISVKKLPEKEPGQED